MEVEIKACTRELRDIWNTSKDMPYRDVVIHSKEKPILKKYGKDVFNEARKRLLK